VIHRECSERAGFGQEALSYVQVLVAYDLVSARDGSSHRVKASGEALDPSDKATAKALSAAYKSAMLQTFCIPVGNEEADAVSHRVRSAGGQADPVQGWPIWAQDLIGTIHICETNEALERVRTTHAGSLVAISRGRPDLYGMIGEAFTARMKELAERRTQPAKGAKRVSPSRQEATETVDA
jgi:hypothetical protein